MTDPKIQENPAYTLVLYDAILARRAPVAYIPAFDRIVDYISLIQPHKPPCLDENLLQAKATNGYLAPVQCKVIAVLLCWLLSGQV